MDTDKLLDLIDFIDKLSQDERKFIFANLNHIIERYNDKFSKQVSVRF